MAIKGGAKSVVLFSVALAATGCAYGEMREVLRTSLADEAGCTTLIVKPRNAPHLRDIHPEHNNQYIVDGCGLARTYTCPAATGLVEYGTVDDCTFVEGNANDPKLATSEPGTSGGETPADSGDDDSDDEADAEDEALSEDEADSEDEALSEDETDSEDDF